MQAGQKRVFERTFLVEKKSTLFACGLCVDSDDALVLGELRCQSPKTRGIDGEKEKRLGKA